MKKYNNTFKTFKNLLNWLKSLNRNPQAYQIRNKTNVAYNHISGM